MILWAFVFAIQGLLILPTICQDPCSDPIDISDERRSVNYTSYDGNFLCDVGKIVEGHWYTFNTYTGGKMPQQAPEYYSCGTQAPIWFSGEHPTDGEVHDATACVNLGSGCDLSYPIQVKLCPDGEYVYKLAEPEGCDLAYCAGSGIPCEAGKVYVESEKACTGGYPVMSEPPELIGPKEPTDLYTQTFWFECSVKNTNNSARFEVTWLFDNTMDPNIPPEVTDSTSPAKLDELKLIGHMDQTVSCAVKSFWPDHLDTPSPSLISKNGYWVGIKVPPEIELPENKSKTTVVLESTVPITCGCCKFNKRDDCRYEVQVNSNPKVGGLSLCTGILTPGNKTAVLSLNAERSHKKRDELHQILFKKVLYKGTNDAESIWKDYEVTPIKVHITNAEKMGYCESVTDPHIQSFDRANQGISHFHVYTPGKFVLVNSTSPRTFEIHSILKTCDLNRNRACNCGVAVREGNVVLGVDNCGGQFQTIKEILVEDPYTDGTITNDEAGTTFTIVMPSGAKVIAQEDKNWHLNVYVYLPTEFKNTTSGLCGSWDDDYENDFKLHNSDKIVSHTKDIPKEFSDSYRIPKGESFFEKLPCDRLHAKDEYYFCKCLPDTSRFFQIQCGLPNDEFSFDAVFRAECEDMERKKRQADSLAGFFADLDEEKGFIEADDPTWPTASGITEEQATAKCDAVLKESAVYELCTNTVQVDVDITRSTCVIDVQLADDLMVADSLKDVFESSCVEEAKLNVVIGNNGTDEASSDLAATIASKVCINQCSGHGECENGSCVCDADYIGADCSVDINKTPQIMKVEFDGICDTHLDTCRGIKVTADVIISGTLCRFTAVEVAEDGLIQTKGFAPEFTTSAILSRTKVFCEVPSIKVYGTYQLALSFNGQIFSEESLVSVYNSVCVECYPGGLCVIKPDTCIIDGECYAGSICSACDNAVDIGDPKRSTAQQADDDLLCDTHRIDEGKWYTFSQYTGNMMPEECIAQNSCGTISPIWLNGVHPTASAPVSTGMACANYNGSCCDWSVPVRVRYCTDNGNAPFYAYELTPPPDCDAAYCSGDKMPCMDGNSWDSETDACLPPGGTTIYLEVSDESKALVLANAEEFETAIAGSIHNFCKENTDECCLGMALDYNESGPETSGTSYPVVTVTTGISEETETSVYVKAVITVGMENALLLCGAQDTKDDSLTLTTEVIAEAISAGMADIEAQTGIKILGIGKQTSDTTTVSDDITQENSTNLPLVISLSVIGVVAVLAVIASIVIYAKCLGKKPLRTLSKVSVASAKTLQSLGDIKSGVNSTTVTTDQMAPSVPPQFFNYEEMRPKTGVLRNNLLTPLE